MTSSPAPDPGPIQARLARGFDPAELRRIKRLWVRHSIAEDRRDIDGLIATLSPASTISARRSSSGLRLFMRRHRRRAHDHGLPTFLRGEAQRDHRRHERSDDGHADHEQRHQQRGHDEDVAEAAHPHLPAKRR